MKRKQNRRLVVALLTILLISNMLCITISNAAFNIESANLYSKGDCGQLLKKDGSIIHTTYVVYNKDGKEYPAYCLDKTKPGVGETGNYTVSVDQVLNNVPVWKVIVNGFPYKSPSQLGCSQETEAFVATKMAVYSTLYGYSIENFSAIGEAGQRTLQALNQILTNARNMTTSKISSDLTITQENANWDTDKVDGKYISKTFKVTAKAPMQTYKIEIEGSMPEDTLVTDVNNHKKAEFASGDKFKILLPIAQLGEGGTIKIKATAGVSTKPVFYGKSPNSTWQDYALAAGEYEDGKGIANIEYDRNQTKIKILKQDTNTREPLSGAVFDLCDQNKTIIKTNLVSNENGEILLHNIMPGTYYLKETKAPGDYNLYEEYIRLEIGYNEEISVIVNNSKQEKTTVEVQKNKIEVKPQAFKPEKLPKTGM